MLPLKFTLLLTVCVSMVSAQSDPFIGQIQAFAFTFCPQGWAQADGSLLPINQNTALFSLLGTTYGGNGVSNFALPDLRGRTARGTGDGPATSNVVLGEASGAEQATLLGSNLPTHTHSAGFTGDPSVSTFTNNILVVQAPGQAVPQTGGSLAQGAFAGTGQANIYLPSGSSGTTVQLNGGQNSITTTPSGTVTVGTAGSSLPFSILDPYLGLTYCIALFGIFPTRS